jgi:hypothetical protein
LPNSKTDTDKCLPCHANETKNVSRQNNATGGRRQIEIHDSLFECFIWWRPDDLPELVVEVRVPRGPSAVEGNGELLVVLKALLPYPKTKMGEEPRSDLYRSALSKFAH